LSRFKGGIGSGKDCSRITNRVRFSQGEESRQTMKNSHSSVSRVFDQVRLAIEDEVSLNMNEQSGDYKQLDFWLLSI
jgi:hypothetical protein